MPRRLARLAVAFLALASSAGATTIRLAPLDGLVALSDQVVEARVVARRAEQDAAGAIFTAYECESLDWLKGPGGARFTLRQPGGTVGDVTMVVSGAAHFAPGDRVLLFTKDYGAGQQVTNLAQGALRVAEEPGVAGPVARVPAAPGQFPDAPPGDLAALKRRVRAIVAGAP